MSGDLRTLDEAAARSLGLILDDERADDLQRNGLRLIQSPSAFRFGTDSVLLAHFALSGLEKIRMGSHLSDLGAGSGLLSVLLADRLQKRLSVTAVELDAAQCDRLRRSARLNGLDNIEVVNADLLSPDFFESPRYSKKFDCAVCNPPYFPAGSGAASRLGAATHELRADFSGICRAASRLLRFGGRLFVCFPAARLAEAFTALSANSLEPKLLRLVRSRSGRAPYLALIRAVQGAKPGLIIENDLVIHDEDGRYTPEAEGYYNDGPACEA